LRFVTISLLNVQMVINQKQISFDFLEANNYSNEQSIY